MAVEVHGRVQDLAGVLNRRQRPDVVHGVDVTGPHAGGEPVVLDEMVDDLVEAVLEAVVVALDEAEHVVGHRHRRVVSMSLQFGVRPVELDDELITQDDADEDAALVLEGADLERLGALDIRPHLGGGRGWADQGQDHGKEGDGVSHGPLPILSDVERIETHKAESPAVVANRFPAVSATVPAYRRQAGTSNCVDAGVHPALARTDPGGVVSVDSPRRFAAFTHPSYA